MIDSAYFSISVTQAFVAADQARASDCKIIASRRQRLFLPVMAAVEGAMDIEPAAFQASFRRYFAIFRHVEFNPSESLGAARRKGATPCVSQ